MSKKSFEKIFSLFSPHSAPDINEQNYDLKMYFNKIKFNYINF